MSAIRGAAPCSRQHGRSRGVFSVGAREATGPSLAPHDRPGWRRHSRRSRRLAPATDQRRLPWRASSGPGRKLARHRGSFLQGPAVLTRRAPERACQTAWCDQRRLSCSVGDKPTGARARNPVAGWQPGGRPNELKPIDSAIFGMAASHRAATRVNAQVASRMTSTGGRARHAGAKATRAALFWLRRHRSGGVVAAAR